MIRSEDELDAIYAFFREHGLAATQEKFNLSKNQAWGIVQREKQKELRVAAAVKPLSAEKLRSKAIGMAHDHGYGAYAADFGSYCMVRLYQGQQSDIRYMFVDFKRQMFGRSNMGDGKVSARSSAGRHLSVGETEEDINLEGPQDMQLAVFKLIEGVKFPSREHRAIFVMHTIYNLQMDEIARAFGVSPGAVSQKMKQIEKMFKKKGYLE